MISHARGNLRQGHIALAQNFIGLAHTPIRQIGHWRHPDSRFEPLGKGRPGHAGRPGQVIEGETVDVVRRAPAGDPIEIRILGYSLSLRSAEAETVLVDPV